MIAIVLVMALAALGGCAEHDSSPMAPGVTRALKFSPADGTSGVRLDAAVVIDFGAVVDRFVVESGVRLISEFDMDACLDSTLAGHGTMNTVMRDSTMLRHMRQFHATPGHYSWDGAGTVCTFQPDSLMRPQIRYMVHMSRGMMQMVQQMSGSMMNGGMMGGSMTRDGGMATHFTTVNADGHSGHH